MTASTWLPFRMTDVHHLYDKLGASYDKDRSRSLMEKHYLKAMTGRLGAGAHILDLGCGGGEPIARYFIERGYEVTGVDAAPALLNLCRARFPEMTWVDGDMRGLDLEERFDAIIAWDSFFHLGYDDQRAMFEIFAKHVLPSGLLLFTTGHEHGEAIGTLAGQELYHASLASAEYRQLMVAHGFSVLHHRAKDPECGFHTVWLAEQSA